MHAGRGVFFPIIHDEDLENMLNQETKKELTKNKFEVITPIEYGAMRTIIVKEVDSIVDDFQNDEIKFNIEQCNQWAQVIDVFKMGTTSKMLKVQFEITQMAQRAMKEGLIVLYQKIPPKKMEREIFVRLQPCTNCYGYDHETKKCEKRKMTLCANCGDEGHRQQECSNQSPKCINCGGEHRTLAAACTVRKNLIKERRKQIRQRSRSRSQAQTILRLGGETTQGVSYADITKMKQKGANKKETTTEDSEGMEKMATIILSAVVYSQYMETIEPGSFQKNMDEIYKKNGLQPVIFPSNTKTTGMTDIYKNIMRKYRTNENEGTTGSTTENTDEIEEEEVSDIETEDRTKRGGETSASSAATDAGGKGNEPDQRHSGVEQLTQRDEPSMPPPIRETRRMGKGEEEQSTNGEAEIERKIQKERQVASARPRTSSQSSTASTDSSPNLAEVEITVYIPETECYKTTFAEGLDKKTKWKIITEELSKGYAKINWKHLKGSRNAMIEKILEKKILLDDVNFKLVSRQKYPWIKEGTIEGPKNK